MSKRTKGSKAVSNGTSLSSDSLAVGTSSDGLIAKAEDRIYIDNSNPSDLKMTCDDAVERVSAKNIFPLAALDLLIPISLLFDHCRF